MGSTTGRWLAACALMLMSMLQIAGGQPAPVDLPSDAYVDISQPPYNVKGDGLTDDTEALNKVLADRVPLIYLRDGTYLISDTLRWGPNEKRQILQGQSEDGVILKLKDGAQGFGDPANPKAMLWTGKAPAQRFRNGLRHLTIDTGKNNPGAIGAQFIANNQGGIRQVTIRSGDPAGAGVIGLDLGYTDEQGPCLITHTTVRGFDIGIFTKHAVDGVMFEHITLENQLQAGMVNDGQSISFRGLTSRGAVAAYVNQAGASITALIDANLTYTGQGQGQAAIVNAAGLFARNIITTGYATAIANSAGTKEHASGPEVVEFVSHPILSNFPSPPRSLNLPIEETPDPTWEDPSKWVSVTKFGPPKPVTLIRQSDGKKQERTDWSEALQKAIDSGAKTVYFPYSKEAYGLFGPVRLRGNVERIIGCEATMERMVADTHEETSYQPELRPAFILEEGAAPVVRLERFDSWYCSFRVEQRSKRTLVLSSFSFYELETQPGAGDVFLEDMRSKNLNVRGSRLFARQVNPEGWEEPRVLNDGGQVWILGLKTENTPTLVSTINGGKTEIVGGFFYSNKNADKPIRMFHLDNGSMSVTGGGWKTRKGRAFDLIVEETRNGETRKLPREQAYGRGEQSMIPLFVGYTQPAAAPPAAPLGVHAEPEGTNRIAVRWDYSAQGAPADGFRVEVRSGEEIVASTIVPDTARNAGIERGLRAGQTYSVRVSAYNGAGAAAASERATVSIPGASAAGSGTGLRGEYFNDADLAGSKATRVDPAIDFDWAAQRAAAGLPAKGYSVRWTGHVEPRFSEQYTFMLQAAGGARLWIDDQLLIDNWHNIDKKEQGVATLEAGKQHAIRLEYANHNGGGRIQLYWFSANQPRELISASQLHPAEPALPVVSMEKVADTLAEADAPRTYTARRTGALDESLTVPWTLQGDAVAGADYAIEPAQLTFAAGQETAQLSIRPLDDKAAEPTRQARIELVPTAEFLTSGGTLRLTIADDDGPAAGAGTGLLATYFDTIDFTEPKATRGDGVIDFGWDKKKAHPQLSDAAAYSVRWEGLIQPLYSEEYTFEIDTGRNNAVKVTIDGKPVIDVALAEGKKRSPTEALELTGKANLEAGHKHPIVVEWVQPRDYGAKIRLLWSSPSQFKQVVPATQLYPAQENQ